MLANIDSEVLRTRKSFNTDTSVPIIIASSDPEDPVTIRSKQETLE